MSLLLELIMDAGISSAVTAGLLEARKRFRSKRFSPNAWGAVPWLGGWKGSDFWAFYCPKCINRHKNKGQPQHCKCDEYHKDHFHFKCGDCGYETIMRTADDNE
jgi:hypothetical protein